jgi:uncharacterized protein (UPF0147 family)
MENQFVEAFSILNELVSDPSISRSIKQRATSVISILEDEIEIAIKCDKAIQTLTTDDFSNLDMYTKSRLWSLLSILESIS